VSSGFDHRDTGTPEAAWLARPALVGAPTLRLPGPGAQLIVLAAHPDDETLGAGGLIAAATAAGVRVDVVVATDGAASHPDSPTRSAAQLASQRRREATAAIACLSGEASVTFLGLPDGELSRHQPELARVLEELLLPGCLVVTPWRGDRHPDHEACAFATRAVLRRRPGCTHWQYPIWAWHWADPATGLPWPALFRLDLTDGPRSAKQRALACYVSQYRPLSGQPGDEAVLPEHVLAHFDRPFESFVVEPSHAAGNGSYFDELYTEAEDPWGLADRFYERRKRELVLACLPRPRFRRAFEPGCATGLLTERLAARCDELLACDIATRAVSVARQRLADTPHVTITRGAIPEQWPAGRFDLIVLSEVGYYCDDVDALAERVRSSLADDGILVACHWRHPALDHPRTAAEIHTALGRPHSRLVSHVEEDFLLDVWSTTGTSVAREEGILL